MIGSWCAESKVGGTGSKVRETRSKVNWSGLKVGRSGKDQKRKKSQKKISESSKNKRAEKISPLIFILAYELMLGLQVFCHSEPPRRLDCSARPPVCHIKVEASR